MSRLLSCLGLAVFLFGNVAAFGEEVEATPSDYLGCWIGRFVVGQESSLVKVGITSEGDKVLASIWIPEMDAGPLPMGAVSVGREFVNFGPLSLKPDGEGFLGQLPESMDPSDSLQVRFRRSQWLASDCETLRKLTRETVWQSSTPGGVWSAPLIDEGNTQVIVGTLEGKLLALDLHSGETKWSTALSGSVRSAPVLWNGKIIVVSDDGLAWAVDRQDGEVLRKYRVANALSPPFRSAPGADFQFRGHQLLALPEELLIGTLDGDLHRIDTEGNTSVLRAAFGEGIAALAGSGQALFVATREGVVHRIDSGGNTLWQTQLAGPIHGDLVVDESGLYAGDRGYYLWSLDPDTGEMRWRSKFFFSWVESAPRFFDGVLFVGSSDSKKTRAIDPSSGAVLWAAPTRGWSWASPLIFDGLVIQGHAGQKGYLTELEAGMVFFDATTGDEVDALTVEPAAKGLAGYVVAPIAYEDLVIGFDAIGNAHAWRLTREN